MTWHADSLFSSFPSPFFCFFFVEKHNHSARSIIHSPSPSPPPPPTCKWRKIKVTAPNSLGLLRTAQREVMRFFFCTALHWLDRFFGCWKEETLLKVPAARLLFDEPPLVIIVCARVCHWSAGWVATLQVLYFELQRGVLTLSHGRMLNMMPLLIDCVRWWCIIC